MLDAPVGNLLISSSEHFSLNAANVILNRGTTTQEVQGGPGKQASNWIQIRTERLAANTCRLERNGPTTAKTVTDAWRVTKGALA